MRVTIQPPVPRGAGSHLLFGIRNGSLEAGPLQRGSITRVRPLTSTEITEGAPLLAPFEKWPAAQPTPTGGPAFPLPAAGLTPTSNNDSDLHPQGAQHGIDGFKAWMRAHTEGFVQALPAKAGVRGGLRHPSRSNHLAERGQEYIGVWVFGGKRKIFRDKRIVKEIRRRLDPCVSFFLLQRHYCSRVDTFRKGP